MLPLFLFLDFSLPFLTLSIRRQWRWWRRLCFAWPCWPCAVNLPSGFLLFLGRISCVRAGVHRVHSRHKKQHWKTKPSRFTHLKRHVRTTKDQDSCCKPAHLQSGSARHLCEYLSRPPQDKHAAAYTRESTRLSSQTAVKETVCDVRVCVSRSTPKTRIIDWIMFIYSLLCVLWCVSTLQ